MTSTIYAELTVTLAKKLEQDLLALYGPIMFGKNLHKALGYGSGDAFRQAVCRKTIPIPVFAIEKRKGKFALTKDVALWLARQRIDTVEQENEEKL